jgi:DNA-binding NarL/FixJ family response regulator
MRRPRIYIIDEHTAVRTALAERLAQAASLDVIGHCEKADEAILAVQESKPDVVLVETKRSDGMGLELLRQISSLPHNPLVFVLTSYPSQWEMDAARRAGAYRYLLKDIDTTELIRYISTAASPFEN